MTSPSPAADTTPVGTPHPALVVLGDVAYVTEPATSEIHAVDTATVEILETTSLPGAPIEIAAVEG